MNDAPKFYIGTKKVAATPMTRQAYNDYRGWPLPADENGDDAGYLVEYVDGGKANDTRHVGYISWSPADVFERAYKLISSDSNIEQEIQAKGLTAPRITPGDIDANIVGEHYFTAGEAVTGPDGEAPDQHDQLKLLTFCVLVLRNGFTVTGESACASPENFDAEVGRKIARANAVSKVGPLMGYELKSKLAAA